MRIFAHSTTDITLVGLMAFQLAALVFGTLAFGRLSLIPWLGVLSRVLICTNSPMHLPQLRPESIFQIETSQPAVFNIAPVLSREFLKAFAERTISTIRIDRGVSVAGCHLNINIAGCQGIGTWKQ